MRRWSQLGLMALGTMLALGAFEAPSTAEAQATAELVGGDGMDLHLFRPAVDSKGHLSVNGTDILGHLDFSFGLVLDFGHGILPFDGFENDDTVAAGDARRTTNLIENYATGTLHANLGLITRLVIGIQVPIAFIQGENVTESTWDAMTAALTFRCRPRMSSTPRWPRSKRSACNPTSISP